MISILTMTVAVTALLTGVVTLLWGWLRLRQTERRMDEFARGLNVLSVNQETAERSLSEIRGSIPEAKATLASLRTTIDDLEERFSEVEAYAGVCVPPKPAASGININRRVEAVRLLQEGRSEETVSSELGVPLSEVRLISHLEKVAPKPTPKGKRRVA